MFVVLSLLWGTTWAAIRIGLEGIPPFAGVAGRFAIAALLLLAFARWRGIVLGKQRIERRLWIVNAVLSFTISYGVVYWAEQWIPSGLGSVLFSTYPLLVALISHFVLPDERLTPRSAGGVLVGFAGVAVLFSSDFGALGGRQVLIGSAVMLLSPLASAAASVIVKRYGTGVHPVSLTAMPMALAAVFMAVLALIFERERDVTLDLTSVAALVYLAIFGSAVTFTLYYWLLARVAATRVALIAYVIPVIAVFVGTVFLDEPLTPQIFLGTGLVIAGVAMTARAGRRPRHAASRADPPGA